MKKIKVIAKNEGCFHSFFNVLKTSGLIAACASSNWMLKDFYLKYAVEKKIMIVLMVFLVVFLHVLAVRSGLMAFYLLVLFWVFYFIFKSKKYLLGVLLFVGAALFGIIGSQQIPTLKNKISYMRYSIDLFLKNENIRDLSDSRRLASIQAGLEIGKENPLIGIGIGDIHSETDRYLQENYPALANLDLLPHNQFILYFAATGLIGLCCFVVASFFPLFSKNAFQDFFFVSHHIIYLSSYMVEHTLETQIGTTSYLLFLLLAIRNFDFRNGQTISALSTNSSSQGHAGEAMDKD